MDARSFITEAAVRASATNQVPAGTVLLVTRTGIGKVAIAGRSLCFSQDITALTPDPAKLHAPYLVHFLRTQGSFFSQFARGATIKGIARSVISDLDVPLLKPAEQRRIAAILDQAEALRTQRGKALALMDDLVRSIFREMFGDTLTNPMGWKPVMVGTIADVQGGLQVTTARMGLPLEVPYLRVANVHRNRLDLSEIKTIRATEAEVARTMLRPADLLIVEGHGNPDEVGRAALWTGAVPSCVHQNHLIRMRVDLARIDPAFACEYLNSQGGRQHLLRSGKTTSGLNTISVSNVRDAPVLLPPLALQQAFAERLRAIESLKYSHRTSLAHLDALFASLQHRAFRGEL